MTWKIFPHYCPFHGNSPATSGFFLKKARNVRLWCLHWRLYERVDDQSIRLLETRDATALMCHRCAVPWVQSVTGQIQFIGCLMYVSPLSSSMITEITLLQIKIGHKTITSHRNWVGGSTTLLRTRRTRPTQDDIINWRHFPSNWPFVRGIHRWISLKKAREDAVLCCFLWCAPE